MKSIWEWVSVTVVIHWIFEVNIPALKRREDHVKTRRIATSV